MISGAVTDSLVSILDGSSAQLWDSTLAITSGEQGLSIYGSSRLNFRNSTIFGTVSDGSLIHVDERSNG